VPLYKLARKGVTVEREPREVTVFSLAVTSVELPVVRFTASCSRGTYIRSICHDLGEALGCGAHMTELRRTGCGGFSIDEALSPESPATELEGRVIPLEDALKRGGRAAFEELSAPV
jgi:tRNA pseudouridine55 synthase